MASNFSFVLIRFNPRRNTRGAEAAELQVLQDGKPIDLLWMSKSDVKSNLKLFPNDTGLLAAIAAYKSNKEIGHDPLP